MAFLAPAYSIIILCPNLYFNCYINGILWILRTGAPWRDLPNHYGAWETVAGRFYAWRKRGLWQQILACLHQEADTAGEFD